MSKALVKTSYAKIATFKHSEHAERLDALNTQAQNARRVDVALGLYCFELKEIHLQSGQFGRWLAENKPHLARQNEKGSWEAGRSLEAAMSIAKSALDVCGYKIGDFIALTQNQIPRARGICQDAGQLMLLPAAKLPEEFRKLQEDIFALVDGKSKRQLLSEFKQVDENNNPKIGRAKGSSGLTKAQREAAALRAEQERIEDLELSSDDTVKWLEKNCDDKNVGMISVKKAERLLEAVTYAQDYLTNLIKQRGGKQ